MQVQKLIILESFYKYVYTCSSIEYTLPRFYKSLFHEQSEYLFEFALLNYVELDLQPRLLHMCYQYKLLDKIYEIQSLLQNSTTCKFSQQNDSK